MSNQLLLDIFQKLIQQNNAKMSQLKKDKAPPKDIQAIRFKNISFVKVRKVIEAYPDPINQGSDLAEIKGIGPKIVARIDEILQTNTLEELDDTTPNTENLQEDLIRITGVGPSKAESLLQKDITLEKLQAELSKYPDLSNFPETSILQELTHHQLIGLKYLEDIESRIPRAEIEKIEKKLQKHILELDPKLEIIICGSYRREKETSGDIDMLILHPELKTFTDIDNSDMSLKIIVKKLTQKKLLVDHLTEDGNTKYMGLCKLVKKSKARRIDIRLIPYESKGAAMLYFTGSGEFNKNMRTEALAKNLTINEYGIYKVKKAKGKKIEKGELIPTESEQDIFKLVNMEYVEPRNRI